MGDNANTLDQVTAAVSSELALITDQEILSSIKPLLITPFQHSRILAEELSDHTYSCWTVLQDTASNTAIVYLETPLIPGACWALVSLSGRFLGDDSGWYPTLQDAFADSWAAASLPVWDLLRKTPSGSSEVLNKNMTLDQACEGLNQLNRPFRETPALLAEGHPYYTVELRSKHRPAG